MSNFVPVMQRRFRDLQRAPLAHIWFCLRMVAPPAVLGSVLFTVVACELRHPQLGPQLRADWLHALFLGVGAYFFARTAATAVLAWQAIKDASELMPPQRNLARLRKLHRRLYRILPLVSDHCPEQVAGVATFCRVATSLLLIAGLVWFNDWRALIVWLTIAESPLRVIAEGTIYRVFSSYTFEYGEFLASAPTPVDAEPPQELKNSVGSGQ